ncbi:hypothetical protein Bbelb_186580 [Branchiostoma belcheri]|nr:hypothetical protein Bbelb_186580 [Branchiostoma belcheri]
MALLFCKQALHVPRSACGLAARAELGSSDPSYLVQRPTSKFSKADAVEAGPELLKLALEAAAKNTTWHVTVGKKPKPGNIAAQTAKDILDTLDMSKHTAFVAKLCDSTREEIISDEHLSRFQPYIDAIDAARDDQAEALEEELEEQENQLAYSDGADDSMTEDIFTEACSMVEDLFQSKY